MSAAAAGVGIAQFGLSFIQSQNQRAVGAYQQRIADFNAKMAEKQADRVIEVGAKNANKVRAEGQKVEAAQKVNFAAQGIDISSGSALAIQQETAALAAEDARTVENNAFMEAMGLRYEALNTRQEGRMAYIGANLDADMSLVQGGLQGALSYQRLKGNKPWNNQDTEPMSIGHYGGKGSYYPTPG